ncbi:hypothetical protein Goe19_00580 [Bacillus phage vB_BsuM-Goe19]|nr:hypothetical protein Goe19_00580 [Bacillus phage vB_BsuM-Goe19]
MKEIWKDVVGYEHRYEISNLGNIRTKERRVNNNGGESLLKQKILSPYINNYGYCAIKLTGENKKRKTKYIHRLVCEAFLGIEEGKEPNHIDGNKKNNRLDNLEWVDHSTNIMHAFETGLIKSYKPKSFIECDQCSKPFKPLNSTAKYCSPTCSATASRKVVRPTKQTLLEEILNNPFSSVGNKYGVSENTIRKWCKKYGIPHTRRELDKVAVLGEN